MKKILSILLVFLFIFNAGGYYFVYVQLLNSFKLSSNDEIREQVSLDRLELIKIDNNVSYSPKDFEKVDDGEIRYNGRMYDIFYYEVKDGRTYYYCVNDACEDAIMNAFAEYLSEGADEDSNTAVMSIIKIIITHAIVPAEFAYTGYGNSHYISTDNISKVSVLIQDIPSPPPRHIS